jgi:hypothetical protein
MTDRDNKTLYLLVGVFTGPIGGAYMGYKYAQLKQELYTLNPQAEKGWDNTTKNVIIGFIFGSLAGILFALKASELEKTIDRISNTRAAQMQTRSHSTVQDQAVDITPKKAQQYWRDQVQASTQLERETQR